VSTVLAWGAVSVKTSGVTKAHLTVTKKEMQLVVKKEAGLATTWALAKAKEKAAPSEAVWALAKVEVWAAARAHLSASRWARVWAAQLAPKKEARWAAATAQERGLC